MINKQSIWVLTLFSLILVLSVYYITMPTEFMASTEVNKKTTKVTNIEENEAILTLKEENEKTRSKEMKELQTILTSATASKEEKNNAYEELKVLNIMKGKEDEISNKIKEKYKLDNFVKIKDDQVRVVIIKKESDKQLAAEIMNLVQDNFEDKMYISIKFQK